MRVIPTKRILSIGPGSASALGTFPLFRDVEEAMIARLAESARYVACNPAHVFVINGETQPMLTIIHTGAARVQCTSRDFGRIIAIGYLGPGSPIGEINLLDGSAHTADVVAVRLTTAIELDPAVFRSAMDESKFLYRNLAMSLAEKIRSNNARSMSREESEHNSVSEVCLALEELIQAHGFIEGTQIIDCKISHEILADLTCVERSTVSGAIAKLDDLDVIHNPRLRIEVLDRAMLCKFIAQPPRD